jgi:hypothetical protein
MKDDLLYLPANPPVNTHGIHERRMANAGTVRERNGERVNPPVYEDIRKNAPPVTARRNFGPGPLNGNLRKRG